MAWTVPTTHFCPYAKGSNGIVIIPPEVLSQLAGAVQDPDEWLVLLHGTTEEDGFVVRVTSLLVPPQRRHSVNCGFTDLVVPSDCVGVLHSHHTMPARFSGTKGALRIDSPTLKNSETLRGTDYQTLNPQFPLSIVISSTVSTDEEHWLGFSYSAEGKVKLPCGDQGVVDFLIKPDISDWPVEYCHPEVAPLFKPGEVDLKDCSQWDFSDDSNNWKYRRVGHCGLEDSKLITISKAFGSSVTILDQLPKAESLVVTGNGKGKFKKGKGLPATKFLKEVEEDKSYLDPYEETSDFWRDWDDRQDAKQDAAIDRFLKTGVWTLGDFESD